MTRTARRTTPGRLYQVVSYLLDGQLLTSDDERDRFLTLLGVALQRTDWRCIAYRLMSDRVCFVMLAGEQPLDSWVRRAHGTFARWFNRRHGRRGRLFADRPFTREVDSLANVVAELHDATAGWSSHAAYLGVSRPPGWLHVDAELADPPRFVDHERVECVREGALLLIPAATPRRIRQSPHASSLPALLLAVSERCGVPVTALRRRYARGDASKAKRIAIHAAIDTGIPIAQIAAALNVTRQRGSAISQRPLAPDEALLASDVAAATRESPQVREPLELVLRRAG